MFKIVKTETLHEGWTRLLRLTIGYPDGRRVTREVEDHGEAATVLPYDPERRVALLLRQFRAAPFWRSGEVELREAPAGLVEDESPAEAVRREAMEEAGVRLGDIEFVASVWAMPGISAERAHLFLAPYGAADRLAAGGGLASENEHITVEELPLRDLAAMADLGRLSNLKLLLLVQTLRLRRPDLFG